MKKEIDTKNNYNKEDIYKNLIQPKKYPDYNKKNYNIET